MDALSRFGKSIIACGSRTISPWIVARFNSVSLIASGLVKLLFKSVMTACKSAELSELTNCSSLSLVDGDDDGDDSASDFDTVSGTLGAGVCDWPIRPAANIDINQVASKNR